MHVCHFCDSTFQTDFFRNIAAGLTQNGVRVSLVELGRGSPPTWLPEVPGVSYLSLNAAGKWQYPMAVRRLARYLRNESVDILHTHLFFAGLIGVLSKRLQGGTVVALMRHHTSVVRMLGSRLHIAADKWMAENADHVMTVSLAARDYMRDNDGIKRDSIEVVYTGFDFEKLSPNADDRARVRRELGFSADDFVVGYIGNFVIGKGHKQLIEAFGRIAAELPQARLLLAGAGTLAEAGRAAADVPGDKIVFAGWRDDVSACLNAMDLFVQPSLSEAFSQVLVEAMGVGLPVIATSTGGAEEVIVNGENGILVPPDDPDAIYRETMRLFRDGELRNAVAGKGMHAARERFSNGQMVGRLLSLYDLWTK